MEFISIDNQSLSVTEDIGFKPLIAHLEPRYNIVQILHQCSSIGVISKRLQPHKQPTFSHHENVTVISLTTGIWSSSVSQMSKQWIIENFEKRQVILHLINYYILLL